MLPSPATAPCSLDQAALVLVLVLVLVLPLLLRLGIPTPCKHSSVHQQSSAPQIDRQL